MSIQRRVSVPIFRPETRRLTPMGVQAIIRGDSRTFSGSVGADAVADLGRFAIAFLSHALLVSHTRHPLDGLLPDTDKATV
jgi:hypothetical protein